jgi:UDP-glucuronate decarboxylase
MRILVTGGAGFIGTNLCTRLVEQGHHVYCLDCHFSDRPHLDHLLHHPRVYRIHHDVIEPIKLKVDQIYHLACPASPVHYQKNPIWTFQTAVWGTKNMLDLAKDLNIPILQASTSEIYGDPIQHPQREDYWGNVNPIGFRSCYDEGKRAAETLCIEYFRLYQVPIRVIRIFNTYGPYMDHEDGRVIPNFISQALFDLPLKIYGEGNQTRSFQYIDDLLDGMQLMINNQQAFTGPVNLGNPGEFTIMELANLILELTGSKSLIDYSPLPPDDPVRRKPDISLAKKMLHWEPKVLLRTGLVKTIEYFSDFLNKPIQDKSYQLLTQ